MSVISENKIKVIEVNEHEASKARIQYITVKTPSMSDLKNVVLDFKDIMGDDCKLHNLNITVNADDLIKAIENTQEYE